MSGETVLGPAAGSEDGRTRLTASRAGGLLAIGGTPVVRLGHLAGAGCAEVWVKMEAANPTGSYKDRMALAMIEAAEADGRLRPGQLVVEYTEPGLQGDRSTGGTKPARLETGAQIQVPLFIETGEKVKVDTRDGSYLGRVTG